MDQDHTSLLVFGKGDGGGGPTWEHLEKLRLKLALHLLKLLLTL